MPKRPLNFKRRLQQTLQQEPVKPRLPMPPPSISHRDRKLQKRQDVKRQLRKEVTGSERVDVFQELKAIKKLLGSAQLLEAIRREVSMVKQADRAIVTSGSVSGKSNYDVVVLKCGSEASQVVARRIRSKLAGVVNVDALVDDVVGIKLRK